MMTPKFNFWLEIEGEVAFSVWRVKLLEAVAQTGSITAGAAKMGVPYRIAWQKIHEMEERLGDSLVETQTGGKEGGGTKLTPLAIAYIEKFNQFNEEVLAFMRSRHAEIFGAG
jgi:molybdate transport system regulatory protein